MRLSTLLARHHIFPALGTRRLSAVKVFSAPAALQPRLLVRPHSIISRSHYYTIHPSSSVTFPQRAGSALISTVQTPSMATSLPESMLEDLQLLQQHYEQLPSAMPPSFGTSDPVFGSLSALDSSFAGADGVEQAVRPAAAVDEQLMMSATEAAADGHLQKRRKLSNTVPSLDQPAAELGSNMGPPPANSHDPALTSKQLDFATSSVAGHAAAGTSVAEEGAATDASLQLVTPPPKLPRGRRGKKAAAAAAPAQYNFSEVGVVPAATVLQQTVTATVSMTGRMAVLAAGAAPLLGPDAPAGAAAAPKKHSKRQPAAASQQDAAAAAADTVAAAIAAAAADAAAAPTALAPVKQARNCKRKVSAAVVQGEALIEQQLASSLPSADAATVDAIIAAAAVVADETAPPVAAMGARGRGRHSNTARNSGRNRGKQAVAATENIAAAADAAAQGVTNGTLHSAHAAEQAAAKPAVKRRGKKAVATAAAVDPAAAAAGDEVRLVKSARRRSNKTAAVGSTSDPEEAAAEAAAAAADEDYAPAKKPTRRRSKKTVALASTSDDADPEAAAAAAKPAKPARRTKKVIAAEVLEAASQGQFGELTNLSNLYSHVALFNNNSNAAAWQQLVQQAKLQPATPPSPANAAEAADQQQQQGGVGSNGRSNSLSLCKTSGLGSFRQQVWTYSQSQSVFDAEAVATQDPVVSLSASQAPAATVTADAADVQGKASDDSPAVAGGDSELQADVPAPQPLTPEVQQQQLKVLPNLGYACLCMTLRKYEIFNSRDCVKKTRDAPDGLHKVSELALQNARDLVPMIHWNEAHGIRLFRLSSNIFPWMTSFAFEDLPHWPDIQKALRAAGDLAKQLGHRLTFHPSEYCKIAGERPDWVTQSVAELEVHSRMFDEMGFLPATPHNKINIHVGGTYGDKDAALERFSKVVNERLSPNCKARLTVENDDRASLYHVLDLMKVHKATGIPIVFDFHHWKFCTGDQTQEEAFRTALTTWPSGVRPVVHWSESPEDPKKMLKAHSEYIDGPINLYGLEGEVDVMIESKGKELALLEYRQYIIDGKTVDGPRTVRAAKFAADAAAAEAAAAEEGSDSEDGNEFPSTTDDD